MIYHLWVVLARGANMHPVSAHSQGGGAPSTTPAATQPMTPSSASKISTPATVYPFPTCFTFLSSQVLNNLCYLT